MEGEVKEETLPPGFRFHPTDEELITFYLVNKISDASFTARAIADVDLNKSEPWDLPGKAKMGEKEWYFFSLRDRKYPTGVRTNRATNTGYWKTTGKDKEIFNSVSSELVGMKKTLVFYRGRAPRGEKTNWVMHEYRIHSKSSFRTAKDEWVVCRVFQKSAGGKKYPSNHHSRAAVNQYSLEMAAASNAAAAMAMQSQFMQAEQAFHHQFPPPAVGGRNYMTNSDLAELTRVLRGSSSPMNLPFQSHMSYPLSAAAAAGEGGGGGFTISGLNLNLGAGATSSEPIPRPVQPSPPTVAMTQQDMTSSMLTNNAHHHHHHHHVLANEAAYGVDMNTGNGVNNRFMAMDNCPDLDNYWPSY